MPVRTFAALIAVFALASCLRAQLVDDFSQPQLWRPAGDGGNSPELAVVAGGMRATYREAQPGWGNIAREVRLTGQETSVRLEIAVLEAAPAAALHLWLVEPDQDMWLVQFTIGGKSTGALGPGEYAFDVPLAKLAFQPRGKGTQELHDSRRLMLGFNFADQTILLKRLVFAFDPEVVARQEAAAAARRAEIRAALVQRGYQENAMYHIALFDDPAAPTPTVASSPDRLAGILGGEGIGITRLDGKALADPNLLDAAVFDLLVLPYGPSFPAEAEDTIRKFCQAGGDFLSLGGYAFDQPYMQETAGPPPNLIRNPGFEEEDTGMWGLHEGSMQEGDASRVVRQRSTEQPHAGTACFEITVPDGVPKAWYNVTQKIEGISPGEIYLATCQLRTRNVHDGFAYMAVAFYDKNDKRISFEHAQGATKAEGTTDWTEQRVSFTIPPNTLYATVHGHLYGFGTAWFDTFEMRKTHAVRLNTRHGTARDALALRDDQIGVFDPSYVFERATRTDSSPHQHIVRAPVRLEGTLEGHVASGMTSANNAVSPKPRARWTSLVQSFDDYGRMTGSVVGITHNFAGTFRHSLWAYCGVENRDLTGDAAFAAALRDIRDHLRRGVFLHSPATEYMVYRPGEAIQATARLANAGKTAASHTVRCQLLVDGKPVAEATVPLTVQPGQEEGASLRLVCPEAPTGTVEVRFELLADGEAIDLLRTGFLVPLDSDSQGLPLGYRDNYFTVADRPAILFGTNQTGVMFGPDYENVLTWMEDYGRCRDYGLNVWRLLHISPFADPDFRERGYQILENPPEWLLRRMDAVFLLAQRYGIVPFPCWHDWTGGRAVSDENLRQQRAFVRVYGERYRHLSAMLWDITNEAQTSYNPIPDLNRLLGDYLRQLHGTEEALRAAWEDETVSFDNVRFDKPAQLWHSRRARDLEHFRVEVSTRWIAGNVSAIRETGDTHPVTDEYYLLPGGDAFAAREHITFSNIHHYPDWTPGPLRYYDRRMQGRAFTVGEFGRRHHPSMKGGGWSWLPEPEVRNFFRRATFLTVGSGGGAMLNWDWKDMRGCVFPWGLNYPNELVPKQVARDWRNLAIFFRSFRPVHQPEDVWYIIPDQFLLGGRQSELESRIKRSLDALTATNIPFSVLRQYELPALAAATPKAVLFPLPYILDDAEVELLADYARRGGILYFSGDATYDQARQPSRPQVLETLCGATIAARRYPDIRREGAPVPAFADQPDLRYDAYPSLELVGHDGILVRHPLGQGQVLFLNDPIELHAETATLAKVYQHLLALPALTAAPGVLAYRLPTLDGELRLWLNEGNEPASLSIESPAKLAFTISPKSQVAAHIAANGAVTAMATDGAGRQLVLTLDGQGIDRAEALLVLPLGEGELTLARDLPVLVGEIVDTRWRTYETLPSSRNLPVGELRSTAFLLLCPADQRERWTKAVETLVTHP